MLIKLACAMLKVCVYTHTAYYWGNIRVPLRCTKDAIRLQAAPGQHRIQAIQPQNAEEVPGADVLSSSEGLHILHGLTVRAELL